MHVGIAQLQNMSAMKEKKDFKISFENINLALLCFFFDVDYRLYSTLHMQNIWLCFGITEYTNKHSSSFNTCIAMNEPKRLTEFLLERGCADSEILSKKITLK